MAVIELRTSFTDLKVMATDRGRVLFLKREHVNWCDPDVDDPLRPGICEYPMNRGAPALDLIRRMDFVCTPDPRQSMVSRLLVVKDRRRMPRLPGERYASVYLSRTRLLRGSVSIESYDPKILMTP